MTHNSKVQKLTSLLDKHQAYRDTCLNLIASENTPSPLVEELFDERLARRYGNYSGVDIYQRNYKGADVIISSTHKTLAGPQGGNVLFQHSPVAHPKNSNRKSQK